MKSTKSKPFDKERERATITSSTHSRNNNKFILAEMNKKVKRY